ncbi:MAG: FxLYD domain-containing protein [Candidatus Nitrosocosmicus sp.]
MENGQMKKILLLSMSLFFFATAVFVSNLNSNIVYGQTNQTKVTLKIQDLSVAGVPTGVTEIQGKAVNNSTSNVKDVVVNMTFYDKKGTLLNKFERNITPTAFVLKPGESHPFNFSELVSFSRIGTSNVTAVADIAK